MIRGGVALGAVGAFCLLQARAYRGLQRVAERDPWSEDERCRAAELTSWRYLAIPWHWHMLFARKSIAERLRMTTDSDYAHKMVRLADVVAAFSLTTGVVLVVIGLLR